MILIWCFLGLCAFSFGLETKPNILLVVVDDLRPALGTYGDKNAYTPNIDKLASRSFVFRNAFAQQSLCAPSRNSFLTGRRPDSLRLYDFYSYWRNVAGNFTTIPQHFRDHGYFTQSIGKIFHPGISSNFTDDALYSWSGKPFHPKTEEFKEAKVCVNRDGSLGRNLNCPVLVDNQPGGTLPDLESLNAATNFLTNYQNESGKPYFLAVGFHKPHVPLKFPAKYLEFHPSENVTLPKNRWHPGLLPSVAWNPWLDVKSREDIQKLNISFPFGSMPDTMVRQIIRNYNAATTYIDDLIGLLLKKVDQNNTIIILTSDHGWSLGEHGEFSKFSNFDIATRIPLVIHVPGHNNRVIFNHLVELVDLFPTLVDLTQISKSLETCRRDRRNSKLCTEGRSMAPIILQKQHNHAKGTVAKKRVFSQYPRPGVFPSQKPDSDRPKLKEINIMGYSIRTERYRYTEWIQFNHTSFKPDWTTVYGREMYDHLIDPDENLNLENRSELGFIIKRLRQQLILGWRYA